MVKIAQNACRECAKGDQTSQYSLGVKLKCTCKYASSSYSWILGLQARHLEASRAPEIMALLSLHKELSQQGGEDARSALLLSCDCGVNYLCIDGSERRRISGKSGENADDKEYNRRLAGDLVSRGIYKTLV
jgi:hypothetical protein